MANQKLSDTIKINDTLAFIQGKIYDTDPVTLTQIVTDNFTEEKISEAKQVLFESTETTIAASGEDIRDIFKVFLETDRDDIPNYVAWDTSPHSEFTRFTSKAAVILLDSHPEYSSEIQRLREDCANVIQELVVRGLTYPSEKNEIFASLKRAEGLLKCLYGLPDD